MKEFLERLQKVTKACREDMHEPDEQEISAIVSGFNLDNAMGDSPYHNMGELTVGIIYIERVEGEKYAHEETAWFNLATLIALARKAKLD